jgi:hypothetical protein
MSTLRLPLLLLFLTFLLLLVTLHFQAFSHPPLLPSPLAIDSVPALASSVVTGKTLLLLPLLVSSTFLSVANVAGVLPVML